MTDYGLVSIITPSYNCAGFIAETIRSIQAQTYPNWEMLITDDCSSDNSCEIIESFAHEDPRIKLFRLEKNSGAGVSRNNSIRKSTGRYIAFCDSDDRWYPEKLEKQLRFMAEKDCALCYSSYMTTDEEGHVNGIVVCRSHESLASISRDDKMGTLTLIYDTSKVKKIFIPTLRKRQDWAMKLKLLLECKEAFGMKEPLAYYRLRNASLSHNKIRLVKYNIAVYGEIFGWSKLHSVLFFFCRFLPSYTIKKLGIRYNNR